MLRFLLIFKRHFSLLLTLCLCLAPIAAQAGARKIRVSAPGGERELTVNANTLNVPGYFCLADFGFLTSLTDLHALNLSACSGLNNLTSLAGLHQLRELRLPHTGINDLSPLTGLNSLEILD